MDTILPAPRVDRRRVLVAATAVLATALTLPVLNAPQASANGDDRTGSRHATEVTLPVGLRPEGITSGPGYRYYVGSLADGRIVTGNLRQGTSKVLLPGETGRQVRGLYYDDRSRLVWAAGNVGSPPEPNTARVWAVDSRTGEVVQETVVPGGLFLNDLVVTRDAVWVTDSRVDRLTVIPLGPGGRPTGEDPTFLTLTGEWPAGDGESINANGIRQLPDGSAVLNNSRVGGLWRVDPLTGVVTEIPVVGGPGITGGDGLELRGTRLHNVRGSGPAEVSVLRLHRTSDGWTARWRGALTDPRLDVPSTATIVGRTLWVVNARFGVASPESADYWITPLRARP